MTSSGIISQETDSMQFSMGLAPGQGMARQKRRIRRSEGSTYSCSKHREKSSGPQMGPLQCANMLSPTAPQWSAGGGRGLAGRRRAIGYEEMGADIGMEVAVCWRRRGIYVREAVATLAVSLSFCARTQQRQARVM